MILSARDKMPCASLYARAMSAMSDTLRARAPRSDTRCHYYYASRPPSRRALLRLTPFAPRRPPVTRLHVKRHETPYAFKCRRKRAKIKQATRFVAAAIVATMIDADDMRRAPRAIMRADIRCCCHAGRERGFALRCARLIYATLRATPPLSRAAALRNRACTYGVRAAVARHARCAPRACARATK